MSTSELAELETLLVRVLPDPKGYAERVVQELLGRVTGVASGGDQPWAVASDEPGADQTLVERNMLLAAALGACDCWGTDPACDICAGEGSAGWTEPDHRLYVEYVEPANRRLPAGKDAAATILDFSHPEGGGSR